MCIRDSLLPAPGIFTHLLDAALSRPAEKLLGKLGVGPIGSLVAGTTRADLVRNMFSAGFLKRFNELEHSCVAAGAEVNSQQLRFAV